MMTCLKSLKTGLTLDRISEYETNRMQLVYIFRRNRLLTINELQTTGMEEPLKSFEVTAGRMEKELINK
jgi:hypothetical protein